MVYLSAEDRRQQFIEAALKVVNEEGIARATTRRIAEAAGASTASLHYCFETKDDLLQAAFEAGTQDALSYIKQASAPGSGLFVAFELIMRAYVRWVRNDPSILLAQLEMTLWSLRNPTSRHLAKRVYERSIDDVAQLLQAARTPEDDPTFDVNDLARLMVGAIDGQVLQWHALRDDAFERVMETFIANIRRSFTEAIL